MATAFRARSEVIATAASATPAEPAGTVQGDVLIALVAVDGTGTAVTAPAGWTVLFSGNSPRWYTYRLARIVRGASAPDMTWVFGSAMYHEVHVTGWSGVDAATPVEASANITAVIAANPDPPSATALSADAMVVAGGVDWEGVNTWVAPASYTVRSLNGVAGTRAGVVISRLLAAAGAEDPGAPTGGATSDDTWAFTLVLKPGAASVEAPPPSLVMAPSRGRRR